MLAMANGSSGGSVPKSGSDPLGITIFVLIVGAIIYLFVKSIAPPPAQEPPPFPPDLATQKYVIVVGSSHEKAEADHIAQLLRDNRISNRLITQDGQFFVIVGSYATEDQARNDLERIREKGFAGARIVKPRF